MKKQHHRIVITTLAAALFTTLVSCEKPQGSANGVITPKKTINFLSDPEFKNFTFNLDDKKSITDKREDVWTIKDGVMHISGKGFGYIRPKQSYRDYHLVMDYKWGEKTFASKKDAARDCGLLVHCHGEDGSVNNTWMPSIEAQLIEGGTGDFLVLDTNRGTPEYVGSTMKVEIVKDRDGETVWKKGGTPTVFPYTVEGKRRVYRRANWKDRDPDWKNVKDWTSKSDQEVPHGGWNRIEVICKGSAIQVLLNGELVNEGSEASPSEGSICLQSEGAELWVRRYELWPLGKFKEKEIKQ